MKLRDFVTINIVDRPRPRWPSYATSVDWYGTRAFDRDFIRERISIGWFPVDDPQRPWVGRAYGLILGGWLALVPECYRDEVAKIAVSVFERVLKNDLHKEHHLALYIEELRNELWGKLEPRPRFVTGPL